MDQNLLQLVKTSFSLWVIIACSVIAVAAAVERAIALWGFGAKARALADAVGRSLFRGDLDDGRAQCEASTSAAAEVFLAALVALSPRGGALGGRPAPAPSAERLMAVVERERQRVNLRLRRGLWILGTVGATAPFVGLFGTVVGIMNAFHDMAHTGQGGFGVVAAGISEALITTAAGIAVAVLAVVLFNAINTHVQKLTLQLRLLTEEYLELVKELLPALAARAPTQAAGGEGLTVAIGGPGGVSQEGEGEGDGAIFADINITPLTDIFLVLLIIFMVTTTAITEAGADKGGFKVTLPKGGKGDSVAARDLSIAILSDGRVVIGGKVVEEPELRSMLTASAERNPDTLVLVQADEGVAHGRVVAVMDLARRLGLQRLAIATRGEGGK